MNGRIRLGMLAAVVSATLTATVGPTSAVGTPACRGARARPSRSTIGTAAGATLCVINQARHTYHLRPFRMNPVLRRIAAGQSHDMIMGGYFGDDSLSGLTPMQRVAASPYARSGASLSVSQNIAWGDAWESTPAAIVTAWLQSAPHREALLTPGFQEVGVGIGLGNPWNPSGKVGAIYTLDLAARGR
jgi:uncharacterized protein YkwD